MPTQIALRFVCALLSTWTILAMIANVIDIHNMALGAPPVVQDNSSGLIRMFGKSYAIPDAIVQIDAMLQDADERNQLEALQAVSDLGREHALPGATARRVELLLDSPSQRVQDMAGYALYCDGTLEVSDAIRKATRSGNPRVRFYASTILIRRAQAKEDLISAVDSLLAIIELCADIDPRSTRMLDRAKGELAVEADDELRLLGGRYLNYPQRKGVPESALRDMPEAAAKARLRDYVAETKNWWMQNKTTVVDALSAQNRTPATQPTTP